MKLKNSIRRRPNAGFSLAEMMVVIVIIGILATMVVPNVVGQLGRSQVGKAKSDIAQLVSLVDQYSIANSGVPPETLEQLLEPVGGGQAILTRKSLPKDPWKMPYIYEPPSVTGTGTYLIKSFGSDKAPGGEGDAADISNVSILEDE